MARDPISNKELPPGFILISIRGKDVVQAQDHFDRNIQGDISDRIVRGWRHPDSAPRSARLAYTAWRMSRMGGPGAGLDPRVPIRDWQIQIARNIVEIPPDEWGTDTEDVIAGLLGEVGGGSYAATEVRPHPGQVIMYAPPRFGPVTPYEVPPQTTILRPGRTQGALWLFSRTLEVPKAVQVYTRKRVVTFIDDWRPYCTDPDDVLEMHERLHVYPPTHAPAQLAWRFFRQFIQQPLPRLHPELMLMCASCLDTYVVQSPTRNRVDQVWIYDKNQAYADYLRRFPNFTDGRFVRVKGYAGPYAVYETDQGTRSGFWITRKAQNARIYYGWAWDGDPTGSSPFADFVSLCYTWSGPPMMQRLVRRFPAFIIGKMNAHGFNRDTKSIIARATYYPLIWVNVIGGLQAEVSDIVRNERPHHAFIDSVHLDHPATTLPIGPNIGEWRLVGTGPGEYEGLNRYRVGNITKHQGQPRSITR